MKTKDQTTRKKQESKRTVVILTAMLMLAVALSHESHAATVITECGQAISGGEYKLDYDLSCPPATPGVIIIGDNTKLDCKGNYFQGPHQLGLAGLEVENVQENVTIENCNITGFSDGMHITNSSYVSINGGNGSKIDSTHYGLKVQDSHNISVANMELKGKIEFNNVVNSLISDNKLTYFGEVDIGYSGGIQVTGNTFFDLQGDAITIRNPQEVSITEIRGNIIDYVLGNAIWGGGEFSLKRKDDN